MTFETNAQIDNVYGNAYRNIKEYKEKSPYITSTFVFEIISGEDYSDTYDIVSVAQKQRIRNSIHMYGATGAVVTSAKAK